MIDWFILQPDLLFSIPFSRVQKWPFDFQWDWHEADQPTVSRCPPCHFSIQMWLSSAAVVLTASSSAGPSPSSHYLRSLLLPSISVDWDVSENPCSDPIPAPIAHLLLEPWLLVQGPWRSHQWRPRQERPWVTQPFFRALSLNHLPLQVHASIYILALQKLLWLPLNFVAHLEASWVLIFPTSFLCAQSMLLYSCLCN